MEYGSSRGRGRGRPSKVLESEPAILRRPHSQNVVGTPGIPIITDNKEQMVNPYDAQNLHELLKTATGVVSAAPHPGSDGNCNQTPNIAIAQNFPIQAQREFTNHDIARMNHSAAALVNVQSSMPQLSISSINHALSMHDARTCQVLTSPVVQNNAANIIHTAAPMNIIQKACLSNMVQNSPSANILQGQFVTPHAIQQFPKNYNVERLPMMEKNAMQQFPKNYNVERLPMMEKNFIVANQLPQELTAMSLNNVPATSMKSNLSADAPEFVPKFASITTVPSSPIYPYSTNTEPGLATDQNSDVAGLPPHAIPQLQFLNNPVIVHVNNHVVNLTLKPHKFGQIAHQLTSILSWQVKDVNLMKEIITVIFEQGVGEANFRYNGARLCQYINKHITHSYNGPSFRDLLIRRCQDEFNCREFYLQHNCERLCGFALFLADIYSQLITATSHYFDKLQTGVCGVLMTLMTRPSTDSLKCVAKVLKGTGHALESCGSEEMDKVMTVMKDVAMTAPVSVEIRTLLLSIIELRASKWGRGLDPNNSGLSNEHPLGTVYYGPNGDILKIVSEDNEDSASDTDDTFFGSAPEEDEEFFKAYDEFLRSQAN